jgi:hypothetical protein
MTDCTERHLAAPHRDQDRECQAGMTKEDHS